MRKFPDSGQKILISYQRIGEPRVEERPNYTYSHLARPTTVSQAPVASPAWHAFSPKAHGVDEISSLPMTMSHTPRNTVSARRATEADKNVADDAHNDDGANDDAETADDEEATDHNEDDGLKTRGRPADNVGTVSGDEDGDDV